MDDTFFVSTVEKMGATKAAVILVRDIVFDRRFRELCKANACGKYGRCWACPPDAGEIDILISRARHFQKALVYSNVISADPNKSGMFGARAFYGFPSFW